MIYLVIFLCYLIFCGIVAIYALMEPSVRVGWTHVIAIPGTLILMLFITIAVWLSGKIGGK